MTNIENTDNVKLLRTKSLRIELNRILEELQDKHYSIEKRININFAPP